MVSFGVTLLCLPLSALSTPPISVSVLVCFWLQNSCWTPAQHICQLLGKQTVEKCICLRRGVVNLTILIHPDTLKQLQDTSVGFVSQQCKNYGTTLGCFLSLCLPCRAELPCGQSGASGSEYETRGTDAPAWRLWLSFVVWTDHKNVAYLQSAKKY